MRARVLALAGCTWLALVAVGCAAEVQLSIRNGRVTIVAKDATVRQILTEWARVGKTKDRQRRAHSRRADHARAEERARSGGARRAAALAQRLHGRAARAVCVRCVAVRSHHRDADQSPPPRHGPPRRHPAVFPANRRPARTTTGQDDEEAEHRAVQPPRPPIFSTFPQPQVGNPQRQGAPAGDAGRRRLTGRNRSNRNDSQAAAGDPPGRHRLFNPGGQPSAPFGATSTPGMIAPAPAQQPGQPRRSPNEP